MVIHILKDRLKYLGKKKKTVKVKLPYKKQDLYSDLTQVRYGDIFSSSPIGEAERRYQRSSLDKI